jgi:hypothetical protein
MCYLIREHQAGAAERDTSNPLPKHERLRPRWVGAAAAALIGGFAVAAIVVPQSTSPLLNEKDSAAPAPLSDKSIASTPAIVERGPALVDDGAANGPDVAKAGTGQCDYGL